MSILFGEEIFLRVNTLEQKTKLHKIEYYTSISEDSGIHTIASVFLFFFLILHKQFLKIFSDFENFTFTN